MDRAPIAQYGGGSYVDAMPDTHTAVNHRFATARLLKAGAMAVARAVAMAVTMVMAVMMTKTITMANLTAD